MKSAHALVAFLICAAMGASAALHAQARGPANRAMRSNEPQVEKSPLMLDEATRTRRTAEMEVWLGHLVGRFRVDGRQVYAAGKHTIQGAAMCSRFGDGAGVRCVIRQTSPSPVMQSSILQVEGVREEKTLPLVYFGINAESLEIQAIVVDKEQVAAQSGVLAEETVNFSDNWEACLRTWAYCWMVTEVSTKTAGEIFMKIAVDNWYNGSKGPPMTLLKSGHNSELEMQLFREFPIDSEVPRGTP